MKATTKAPSRDKVITAAIREFGQYGFDGARIDRIARKARVNKAMIYYHFKNKEALYESILLGLYGKLAAGVASAIQEGIEPEQQLDQFISQILTFIQNVDEDFVRIMLREISSGGAHFIKLAVPNVITPMVGIFQSIYAKGVERHAFIEHNFVYTFMQAIGAIVFFNAMRMTLGNTPLGTALFPGDCFENYRKHLLSVIKHGILAPQKEPQS